MLGGTENQFSLTRAALSTIGRPKSTFYQFAGVQSEPASHSHKSGPQAEKALGDRTTC